MSSSNNSEPLVSHFSLSNYLDENMEIGDIIRKEREAHGLTQKNLASLSGISAVQICRIEKGECIPTPSSLKDISPYIGLSYSLLLIKAGYNHFSGRTQYFDQNGNEMDIDSIVASIYNADSELLKTLGDISLFASPDNILALKLFIFAMRKEGETKNAKKNNYFSCVTSALKKFIIESITPFFEGNLGEAYR